MSLLTDVFEDLLNATCTIQRATAGSANAKTGVPSETWGNEAVGVACRLVRRKGREVLGDLGGALTRELLCMLPFDTNVAEGDVIISGGVTYDVTHVSNAGGAGHHLEATVVARSRT